MATVQLEGINKVYDNGYHAIHDLDLEIADREFLVLVGPSGCGKSTALRMIAGLETISGGTMRIGDRVVNDIEPKDRDIAMVFQNYALYPHMSVYDNIGFALKLAKVPKDEIDTRVRKAAAILELEENLDRKPGQLSGGQRQRVAMGRAIVRQPAAFLMDEPLSNLDAKLRVQMRAEIAALQRELAVTTVYVTHDQIEAMTMGDRVAVLKDGYLQQVDTPQNLYDHPVNVFVAAFIGSPSMNLFEAQVQLSGDAGTLRLGSHVIGLAPECMVKHPRLRDYDGREVIVGIRPEDYEDAELAPDVPESQWITSKVTLLEALGFGDHGALPRRRPDRGLRGPRRRRGEGRLRPGERRRAVQPEVDGAHGPGDQDRDLHGEHALLRHGDPPVDRGVIRRQARRITKVVAQATAQIVALMNAGRGPMRRSVGACTDTPIANSAAVNRIFSTSAASSANGSGITPVELMMLATMNSARKPGISPRSRCSPRGRSSPVGRRGARLLRASTVSTGTSSRTRTSLTGTAAVERGVTDGRRRSDHLADVVDHHPDPDPEISLAEAHQRPDRGQRKRGDGADQGDRGDRVGRLFVGGVDRGPCGSDRRGTADRRADAEQRGESAPDRRPAAEPHGGGQHRHRHHDRHHERHGAQAGDLVQRDAKAEQDDPGAQRDAPDRGNRTGIAEPDERRQRQSEEHCDSDRRRGPLELTDRRGGDGPRCDQTDRSPALHVRGSGRVVLRASTAA